MIDVDWRVDGDGDPTLVAVVVESEAPTPRRVRVESRLDGPVWPPRTDGVPERGWDDGGYEGVVPAAGRLAMGFASPAEPVDPPVEVVTDERADPAPDGGTRDATAVDGAAVPSPAGDDPTPTDVLRALDSPAPPRDAVPDPQDAVALAAGASPDDPLAEHAPPAPDPVDGDGVGPLDGADAGPARAEVAGDGRTADRTHVVSEPETAGEPSTALSGAVASWLTAVDGRVARAEDLAAARDLRTAADAVEAAGGLAAVEDLLAALARDEATLRALADRAAALSERCDVIEEVPLDAYRRLA